MIEQEFESKDRFSLANEIEDHSDVTTTTNEQCVLENEVSDFKWILSFFSINQYLESSS